MISSARVQSGFCHTCFLATSAFFTKQPSGELRSSWYKTYIYIFYLKQGIGERGQWSLDSALFLTECHHSLLHNWQPLCAVILLSRCKYWHLVSYQKKALDQANCSPAGAGASPWKCGVRDEEELWKMRGKCEAAEQDIHSSGNWRSLKMVLQFPALYGLGVLLFAYGERQIGCSLWLCLGMSENSSRNRNGNC